jgi:hypothetical protein
MAVFLYQKMGEDAPVSLFTQYSGCLLSFSPKLLALPAVGELLPQCCDEVGAATPTTTHTSPAFLKRHKQSVWGKVSAHIGSGFWCFLSDSAAGHSFRSAHSSPAILSPTG